MGKITHAVFGECPEAGVKGWGLEPVNRPGLAMPGSALLAEGRPAPKRALEMA